LFDGLPRVVALRISPPFKEILKSFVSSEVSMFPYCFHLVFVLTFDEIRWWSQEVWAVRVRFNVRGKKAGVKNRVNVPLDGEFQMICDGRYDFCDFEGAVASWSQFYCPI